jgi:hypothetical protein
LLAGHRISDADEEIRSPGSGFFKGDIKFVQAFILIWMKRQTMPAGFLPILLSDGGRQIVRVCLP